MSKKYKFLVADDHSIVRQGVSFVLKELYQGATIIQADNFSEILKLVNLEKIDLSDLSHGVYFVRSVDPTLFKTFRLVK